MRAGRCASRQWRSWHRAPHTHHAGKADWCARSQRFGLNPLDERVQVAERRQRNAVRLGNATKRPNEVDFQPDNAVVGGERDLEMEVWRRKSSLLKHAMQRESQIRVQA